MNLQFNPELLASDYRRNHSVPSSVEAVYQHAYSEQNESGRLGDRVKTRAATRWLSKIRPPLSILRRANRAADRVIGQHGRRACALTKQIIVARVDGAVIVVVARESRWCG